MNPTATPSCATTLRHVRPDDAAAMQAFVEALGAASRRARFHGAVNGCSPGLLRHLIEADGQVHVALVACVGDTAIVGDARYVVARDGEAELAIAVADSQRGRGLAGALLDELLRAAAAAGLQSLYGDVLIGNGPMEGLMRRRGFVPDPMADAAPGVMRWVHPLQTQARPRWARLGAWVVSVLPRPRPLLRPQA